MARVERGGAPPSSSDDGSDSDADVDGDRVAATADAPFVKVEKAVRTAGGGASGTVRNLRIREDTAKYLTDLRPDAPHYDPKSRSMRRGEGLMAGGGSGPASALALPGGGDFVRPASDADGFAAVAAHAAAAFERGHDVNAFAAPSQAAALAATFTARKAALDAAAKGAVTAAYGNAAAPLDEEARALLTGQTEAYVEYSGATGRPLVGAPPPAVSRYEEDVFPGNHTSVWGSWFEVGTKQWGYACCHATAKGAYCLGEAGRRAAAERGGRPQLQTWLPPPPGWRRGGRRPIRRRRRGALGRGRRRQGRRPRCGAAVGGEEETTHRLSMNPSWPPPSRRKRVAPASVAVATDRLMVAAAVPRSQRRRWKLIG